MPGLLTVTGRHGLMGNNFPFSLHLGEDFPVDGSSAAFQPRAALCQLPFSQYSFSALDLYAYVNM
ncbi:hypothetical protein [Heliobacterium mobile]|uniref:hypothetical protein n=1 Tax=Heliobacterium mobile TaxID=28064 RepID=UPI001478682E|nr:hypothetical protein [Heliobacterium mobile]